MTTKATPTPDQSHPAVNLTSIRAHAVLTVSVTMSTSEMDTLCRILNEKVDNYALSDGEHAVRTEFISAVDNIR